MYPTPRAILNPNHGSTVFHQVAHQVPCNFPRRFRASGHTIASYLYLYQGRGDCSQVPADWSRKAAVALWYMDCKGQAPMVTAGIRMLITEEAKSSRVPRMHITILDCGFKLQILTSAAILHFPLYFCRLPGESQQGPRAILQLILRDRKERHGASRFTI